MLKWFTKALCPSFKCPSPKSKDLYCCFGATFTEAFQKRSNHFNQPIQPTNPNPSTKKITHFPNLGPSLSKFSDELPQVTTVPSILIHAKALTEDWICWTPNPPPSPPQPKGKSAVVGGNVGTVDGWNSQPSPGKSYHILESLSEFNLVIKPYQLV